MLLLLLLGCAPAAFAAPSLRLGFSVTPALLETSLKDSLSIPLYVDLDTVSARPEGFQFYVAQDCSLDAECHAVASVEILAFLPDTSWIGGAEQQLCDQVCGACRQCARLAHWRVHIRTDRISSIPTGYRGRVGNFLVRTTRAHRPTELRFDLALLWFFGRTPLETHPLDVQKSTNRFRLGGVAPDGSTSWGMLRRMYR